MDILRTSCLAAALVVAAPLLGQETVRLVPDQVEAGRGVYERSCAECHRADLSGDFEAPALAGRNFLAAWRRAPLSELLAVVRDMPPEEPGTLSEAQYLAVTAFLLEANGASADQGALAPAQPVGDVLAQAAAPGAEAGARQPAAEATDPAGEPPAEPARATGRTTVEGSIGPLTPVTDAMLRDPDPADWLMYRRTYDAWGYSPLDQIRRENVADLELAWVWAMADGANQPTPLVLDGIMFLANPGNIIQALDAASGDLLWEYRRQFPDDIRPGRLRPAAQPGAV